MNLSLLTNHKKGHLASPRVAIKLQGKNFNQCCNSTGGKNETKRCFRKT